MIASDDVRRVTFDRAMRGYRCEDVDDRLRTASTAWPQKMMTCRKSWSYWPSALTSTVPTKIP